MKGHKLLQLGIANSLCSGHHCNKFASASAISSPQTLCAGSSIACSLSWHVLGEPGVTTALQGALPHHRDVLVTSLSKRYYI